MVERRAPIDRVVDLAVAVPAATFVAACRAVPLAARAGTVGAARAIRRVSESVSSARAAQAVDDGTVAQVEPRTDTGDVESADQPVAAEPHDEATVVDEVGSVALDELPIEGYDDLAARQVVARLEGLDRADLGRVEAYEREHRNRSTVLGKIAALS